MSAEPGRPQPGPNNDDLTSLIQQIAPRLAVYIRSATCGSGLGHADADDICCRFPAQDHRRRAGSQSVHRKPSGLLHHRHRKLYPRSLPQKSTAHPYPDGDSLLADSRSPAPDHAAEQSEELEKCHRRQQQLNQWIGRVIPLLDGLLAEFVELNRIKENLPVTGNDVEPAPPQPADRPTSKKLTRFSNNCRIRFRGSGNSYGKYDKQ